VARTAVVTPLRVGEAWTVAVDPAWPGFAGHFPGNPLVPAAELIAWAMTVAEAAGVATACIARAKFLLPVRPGDAVTLRLLAPATVRVERAGERVAEVVFGRG